MKSTIFWGTTPCSPLRVDRRFEGTYSLHLQGKKKAGQETSVKAGGKHGFACFDPEDEGDVFLRNVGRLSTDYMAYSSSVRVLCSAHGKKTTTYISVYKSKFNKCVGIKRDRLCGLVVRVSGYRSRGPGFDPRFSEKQRIWNGVHSAS
jgi:hypothetical protein